MKRETVTVGLGERGYDIHIGEGLLDDAGAKLAPLLQRSRVFVVTEENVWRAQGARLAASLDAAGIEMRRFTLAPGEQTKSFASLEKLTGDLLDAGAARDDLIVAFGGGVIGDLTGFASAILKRGCRFAQVPTTLLAQVDSAVGGKTGVNTAQGKNLVGVFHQPAMVLSDVGALSTLPPRELSAGLAEVVKYGALGDPDFFEWLEGAAGALLSGDPDALIRAVVRSCEMKAAIVAADERERGERALLNLGHTFGHALEAAYGFSDALLHGEAVAVGMGLAFDFAAAESATPAADAARLKACLRAMRLPAAPSDLPACPQLKADFLLGAMRHDKKNLGAGVTLVLARGLGAAYVAQDMDPQLVHAFLKEKFAQAARQE